MKTEFLAIVFIVGCSQGKPEAICPSTPIDASSEVSVINEASVTDSEYTDTKPISDVIIESSVDAGKQMSTDAGIDAGKQTTDSGVDASKIKKTKKSK